MFTVRPAAIDESLVKGESAIKYVERLAREKALAVAEISTPGDLVLGADTAVVTAGRLLAKPRDAADAAQMLRTLSGASHYVTTGYCLVRAPGKVEALSHALSLVVFKPLTGQEIQDYIATGEPLDKAGAYAAQGAASKFIDRVEGSLDNVIGLPVKEIAELLRSLGES